MSEEAKKTATQEFDLAPGLVSYYASQAQLMLAQFENINNLLGPTHDWTHPGNYCEVLFRDFLRKFLPPSLSVDKGFFYGRTVIEDEDSHCPEIDILIHESHEHAPIFRMDDFVIVKPQAVRGMIQIKRTLDKEQVRKGIENVVKAKKHLRKIHEKTPDLWEQPGWEPRVYTAVVGFNDKVGADDDFYQSVLAEFQQNKYEDSLPNIVGSLKEAFVYFYSGSLFLVYNSVYSGDDVKEKNVFVQVFLDTFYRVVMSPNGRNKSKSLPISHPSGLKPVGEFSVPGITKVEVSSDVVRIELKNGTIRTFTKISPGNFSPNNIACAIEVSPQGIALPTANLKAHPFAREIFVRNADRTVERYEISSGN